MDWKVFFAFLFAYVSRTYSQYEDTYAAFNNIRVEFPDHPCNRTELQMPDFSAPGRRISEVKCFEHTWKIKFNQGRIVRLMDCEFIKYNVVSLLRGHEAENGEYPHIVIVECAIGWKGVHDKWIFKCGGSLISEKFVLTAAHCSQVTKSDKTVADQKPKIVRLGSKSIMNFDPEEKNKPAYDVKIKLFINHHRYKPPRQYYDIALIELESEVPFVWRIHPSCLWTRFDNPKKGTLTGWGVIDIYTRKKSPRQQTAEINIIDYELCDIILEKKIKRNWWGFMRHQLCAGDMTGGIDSCQGDSGGPLQSLIPLKPPLPIFRWNLHYIIGVTSFGFGCGKAQTPSIYTRVASFIGWIEDIVWKNNSTDRKVTNENRFYFST